MHSDMGLFFEFVAAGTRNQPTQVIGGDLVVPMRIERISIGSERVFNGHKKENMNNRHKTSLSVPPPPPPPPTPPLTYQLNFQFEISREILA
jgi:hypothetical protein